MINNRTLLVWNLIVMYIIGVLSAPQQRNDEESFYRLPKDLKVRHYEITLRPMIEHFVEDVEGSFKFEGTVNITLYAPGLERTVNKIILNAKDIEIQEAKLYTFIGWNEVKFKSNVTKPDYFERITYEIVPDPTVTDGNGNLLRNMDYIMTVKYTGRNRDDMTGFYRSYYKDENTKIRWLLTTQLSPVYARRVFPCLDEPEFKATFNVSIEVSKKLPDYHVLFNGENSEIIESWSHRIYKFQGGNQSTHNLAFTVSDLTSTSPISFYTYEKGTGLDKKYRTWGRSEYIDVGMGNDSQECGPSVLNYLSLRLGHGYPYSRLDQVGVPDYSEMGNENSGLLTYRERMLLADKDETTASAEQNVVLSIARGISHQWFGTLDWWSDTWLNEGLANFLGYLAADEITSDNLNTMEWGLLSQFVIDELQEKAFQVDSVDGCRPLFRNVTKPEEIEANYDVVASAKGSSVLRMFYHVLGEENFFGGLRQYIFDSNLDYGTPQKLIDSFKNTIEVADEKPNLGGFDLQDIFTSWLNTSGYPVVKAKIDVTGNILLTQKKFVFELSEEPAAAANWFVPITYVTSEDTDFENTTQDRWLPPDNSLQLLKNGDWYLVNVKQTGYYRVNYDEDNWKELTKVLLNETQFNMIHPINRAQLIDDSWNLARSTETEYLKYEVPLGIVKYLIHETDYIPWRSALRQFNFLKSMVSCDPEAYQNFKNFVLDLLINRYNNLTFDPVENETHTDKLNRGDIISWACSLELTECVSTAGKLFTSTFSGDSEQLKLNPDVKLPVYCAAARTKKEMWQILWNQYLKSGNAEQNIILTALGCSKDETILVKYLQDTVQSVSTIRKQDRVTVFQAVYNGNPENVRIALDFLQKNVMKIAKSYGGSNPIGDILIDIADKLNTYNDLEKIESIETTLMSSNDPMFVKARPSVKTAITIVKGNIQWMKKKHVQFVEWYSSNTATNINFAATSSLYITFIIVVKWFISF